MTGWCYAFNTMIFFFGLVINCLDWKYCCISRNIMEEAELVDHRASDICLIFTLLQSCFFSFHITAVTCPPLKAPAYGSISPNTCLTSSSPSGSSCSFSCQNGFRLTSGSPNVTCTSSGQWGGSGRMPVCEGNCEIFEILSFPSEHRVQTCFYDKAH